MAQLPGFCRVQASLLAEKKKKKWMKTELHFGTGHDKQCAIAYV